MSVIGTSSPLLSLSSIGEPLRFHLDALGTDIRLIELGRQRLIDSCWAKSHPRPGVVTSNDLIHVDTRTIIDAVDGLRGHCQALVDSGSTSQLSQFIAFTNPYRQVRNTLAHLEQRAYLPVEGPNRAWCRRMAFPRRRDCNRLLDGLARSSCSG